MYIPTEGNLLASHAEALVNPVNCAGAMGKGLALQFRKAYPNNYRAYQRACNGGKVQIGDMFVYALCGLSPALYIINFPTKRHWRDKSRLGDIDAGLSALVENVGRLRIRSVAVPALGCGLGGLHWADVQALMLVHFAQAPDVEWFVFGPVVS